MKYNDPITDAVEYAKDHPVIVATAAYLIGTSHGSRRRYAVPQQDSQGGDRD